MSNRDKNVLVTGATGRQGGAVIRHMLPQGWMLRALTRNPASHAAKDLARQGVEVRLHRVVAGVHELSSWCAIGVDRGVEEEEPGGGQGLADVLGVLAQAPPAGGHTGGGRRAELELTAWFVGDEAAARRRTGLVEEVAQESDRHDVGGVVGGHDQPLQLGADEAGWACLETHPPDEPLDGGTVDQPLRGVTPQHRHPSMLATPSDRSASRR